ncbi:uncharacterized protein LOC121375566 [Gigantopelta aegis]|uniref:uncharacterized protein LOC121375566 n=1 Tax=Gigantopelta aegis TaxID=1735272 RepID=UPI001B88DD76|nr:uncharacterized protein LOC121375566 [Gigantopelta aegis]
MAEGGKNDSPGLPKFQQSPESVDSRRAKESLPFNTWTQFSGVNPPVSPSGLYSWDQVTLSHNLLSRPPFMGHPPPTQDPLVVHDYGIEAEPGPDYYSKYSGFVQDIVPLPPFDDLSSSIQHGHSECQHQDFMHPTLQPNFSRSSPQDGFSASPQQSFSPGTQPNFSGSPHHDFLASPQHDFLVGPPQFSEDFVYDMAQREGYDMYAKAMNQLNSCGNHGVYNPFGTADVLSQSRQKDFSDDTADGANAKPTYSDIAKTLKSKPMQKPKEKEDFDNVKKKMDNVPKNFKPAVKKPYTRAYAGRTRSVSSDGNVGSVVLPDSKYGLDQFEEKSGGKGEKSGITSSSENLSYRSRKGSTSSVSSGTSATSGIEEILLTKPLNNLNSGEGISKLLTENSRKSAYLGSSTSKTSKEEPVAAAPPPPRKEKNERLFFDPKRIFQRRENKLKGDHKTVPHSRSAETVLNNGKPANLNKASSVASKKTDYINNDLRDSRKRTNQSFAMTRDSQTKKGNPSDLIENGGTDSVQSTNGKVKKETSSSSHAGLAGKNVPLTGHIDWKLIDDWLSTIVEKTKGALHVFLSFVFTVLIYLLGIIMYLVTGCVHYINVLCGIVWGYARTKIFKQPPASDGQSWNMDGGRKRLGLDENIVLPNTGEEAMRRLLACKGKDSYSILGLRADASDEDIKKYYRKQAVLVHPDKNQEPGAEEGFKILGHAFEMIGEPGKRKIYDLQMQEATEAEAAMREFADLLSTLEEKISEARNLMRCDNCGGKHKRIPIDRAWYSCRFCSRCNTRHSAKEGDIWAETSMLGFRWHYYACMEQNVYCITEWVACHKDFFKSMQPNAHPVFYRIATDGNRTHRRTGEHDIEDFLSHLFHKASMQPDGSSPWQQQQQQKSASQSHSAQSPWTPRTSGPTGKKGRRKKKRS